MTPLCEIAAKWGTDKVPSICHGYTPYYYEMFKGRNVKKLLEIGIGYPETMCYTVGENYRSGASLFMLQEYFPEAEIYALDIREDILINEGRIRSFQCDQGSEESLRSAAAKLGGGFDIVIDDGSHLPEHQVLSAVVLIPLLLKPDGLYIIEDVWAPDKVVPNLPYRHELVSFNLEKYISDQLIVIRGETIGGGPPCQASG